MDDFDGIADGPLLAFIESATQEVLGRGWALPYAVMATYCLRAHLGRVPLVRSDAGPGARSLLALHQGAMEHEIHTCAAGDGLSALGRGLKNKEVWKETSPVDADAYTAHLEFIVRSYRTFAARRRLHKDKVAEHLYREWFDRHEKMVLKKIQQVAHASGLYAELNDRGPKWSLTFGPREK